MPTTEALQRSPVRQSGSGLKAVAMGRPSKFKPEFVQQAETLCMLGATDQEMADFFKVEVRTFYRWKNEHADFCQSLKVGKEAADARVERSLFQRAIGYEQDEVKIFMPANAGAPVYAPFRAKIAPDTTAAIFWLKNRRPDLWRDRSVGDKDNPLHIKSSAQKMTDDELLALAASGGKSE